MRWLQAAMCSVLAVGVAAPVVTHATTVEETATTTTNYLGTATITYIGKWHVTEITRNWSGGTAAASKWATQCSNPPPPLPNSCTDASVPAAKVTLSFSGTGVTWIGVLGPQLGIANIYVDGVLQQQPANVGDTYAPTEQIQKEIFSVSGLANVPHTLAIEVSGTKNGASSDYIIVVDAFDIVAPSGYPSGRIQETGQTAVTYYGGWILGDNYGIHIWSGGTAAYSYAECEPGIVNPNSPPPPTGCSGTGVTTRAVFTFRGTGVTWIGNRHPQGGQANVYIDGILPQSPPVDTWWSVEQSQQRLFTSGTLTQGIHTLAIEVLGTQSTASNCAAGTLPSCFIVSVDAFDVTP